jgi:hypothetical protein
LKILKLKIDCPPKEDPSLKEKLIIENCPPEAPALLWRGSSSGGKIYPYSILFNSYYSDYS